MEAERFKIICTHCGGDPFKCIHVAITEPWWRQAAGEERSPESRQDEAVGD